MNSDLSSVAKSFDACEYLVKSGDPDRFLSTQAATPQGCARLMAVYAVNLEIARAPWASQEPLVAQMRLRWWGDAIADIYRGKTNDSHEILPALRYLIFDHNLPHYLFETLIEARHFDIFSDAHESPEAFNSYINATAGTVMELAARVLNAGPTAFPVIRDFAYGAGVAALLRAAPELIARGRNPLPGDVASIVSTAQQKISAARRQRHAIVREVRPALLAGWRADATLSEAVNRPESVTAGLLVESPARRMATLRWRRGTGRW